MTELRATGDERLEASRTPALEVRSLEIDRLRADGAERIVTSVRMSVGGGETIGIVGESGSGKSVTGRALVGLLPRTLTARGEVMFNGRNLLELGEREWRAIRGREIGLILQDPFTMLNPVIRCGQIVEESILPEQRHRKLDDRRADVLRRLAEVGITDESVIDRYPFQLSGGMRQRIAIAAALARDPQILIADEPSTALDVTTQKEILALLRKVQRERGMGLVLITHDLRLAFAMCDRIYVLYAGSLVEAAPARELEDEPLHPYAHGLLLSEPPPDRRVRELAAIGGSVPRAEDVVGSCTFASRCRWAQPECVAGSPPLREVAPGRWSACVRVAEIRAEMGVLRERLEEDASPPEEQRPPGILIQVRDAEKTFDSGGRIVHALDGVSIEVRENESVGLVGESGSGKTTLSRLLVGLDTASGGELSIDGVDVSAWAHLKEREKRRLRGFVQIVFQDPYSSLNPMRTIGATLSEAVTLHQPRARDVRRQVEGLLRSVGLPAEYAVRKPVALSGGERQRVAIARALAVEPRVLICDEPVSALDVSVQAQILNLFAKLRAERGLGYLFITHDLSIVRQVTEHLYVMHKGRVVESGPTEWVLSHPQDPYTIKLIASAPRSEAGWLEPHGQVT